MADLGALVAKAQALGAQLLAAQQSARQRRYFFQKDNSNSSSSLSTASSSAAAIARARMLRKSNLAVTAELVTTAQLEPRDLPSSSSSSSSSASVVLLAPPSPLQAPPHGSLIRAENWTDMRDAVARRRRHGHAQKNSRRTPGGGGRGGGGGGTETTGSRTGQEQQERDDCRDINNKNITNRQKPGRKEQLSCHEDLFERHFQSLDRALLLHASGPACEPAGATTNNNNNHHLSLGTPAGTLLVILEQVKEEEENEEASSSSSSVSQGRASEQDGMWEDPASDNTTLAETRDDCPLECCCCCDQEAHKEALLLLDPRETAREHEARVGGGVVRQRLSGEDGRGLAVARRSSTSKISQDQEEDAYSVRRVLSSSSSSSSLVSSSSSSVPDRTATAKDLDVPERLPTMPPPPYVASIETV